MGYHPKIVENDHNHYYKDGATDIGCSLALISSMGMKMYFTETYSIFGCQKDVWDGISSLYTLVVK